MAGSTNTVRLNRLMAQAGSLSGLSRRDALHVGNCRGLDDTDLADRFEAALPEGGREVLDTILDQLAEYQDRPPRELPGGNTKPCRHGLNAWLDLLQLGAASLPDTIPLDVLLAWRNGYANHPAKSTPIPLFRCEGCHMALPNAAPDGEFGRPWTTCPACGSERLSFADLSKPAGHFLPYQQAQSTD